MLKVATMENLPLPIVGEGWGEGGQKRFTPILTFPHQGGRKCSLKPEKSELKTMVIAGVLNQ